MKERFYRIFRSGVCLLLTACLLTGMMPGVAFAQATDGEDVIRYVALGASNTNGYGMDGYLPAEVHEDPLAASKADLNVYGYKREPANAYPAKVAAALKVEYGKTVELDQLAISSMRVEEVRYLLDDTMIPDAYMNWRFTGGQGWFDIAEPGGVAVLRKTYQESLKNADYITVDLGWNNFGVFAFNNIKAALADGRYWKAPDFSYYDEKLMSVYDSIKQTAIDKLSAEMSGSDSELMFRLELMADILTAATMGACFNYDVVMEKIYDLNPDAEVVVINIQNLADDLVVEFDGVALHLGDLYGELIDLVNMYRANKSPYADRVIFADAGDVETFLDELVSWNGDPAALTGDMQDCFDMYDDGLYVRSIVEYMMVGQALSGLFQGFRDMAAQYGLEVFADDDQYTYAFMLSRTPDQLLSLDLGALDFNNPGGNDEDVERYGAAVAKHLKNLRGEGNLNAYNYVFENLLDALISQKSDVEALLANATAERDALVEEMEDLLVQKAELEAQLEVVNGDPANAELIAQIEASIAQIEEGIAQYETGIAQYDAGIADAQAGIQQLTQAIEQILPAAQAEFSRMLQGIYNSYHNTLYYAYDIVATIFQEAAKINKLQMDPTSMSGFGSVADTLMGAIASSFINGSMNKFYYELQKNGVNDTGVTEDPAPMVEDVISLIEDNPAAAAVAVLAVRYELGNSFYAHPNAGGHDQITEAVMSALKNGSDASDFTDGKFAAYFQFLKNNFPKLCDLIIGNVDIGEMESLILGVFSDIESLFELVEDNIGVTYSDFEAAYNRAIRGNYIIDDASMLVAIGDDSAAAASYVDTLAEALGVNYCNLAKIGTILDAHDIIADNADILAAADLITVGYGNNTFTRAALSQLSGLMTGNPVTEYDWTVYVGEVGAERIQKTLVEIEDMLLENGMDGMLPMTKITIAHAMTLALEAYAHAAVSYAWYLPGVVNAIHAVNPDALVVVVGMNNSFDGTTLTMEDSTFNMGDYIAYLVDGADLHGLIYAMVSGNCIYVEAPDAETDLTGNEYNVIDFVLRYGRYMDGNPTEAGHEYITAQILNALNISYYTPEEPEVLPEGLFRLKGTTRYETGFAIANQVKELLEVEKFETVVVAFGEKFPDALTGSYLAAKYNAPILLTDKKVDADVVDYINNNVVAGGNVFILGGEAAVSEVFESDIKALGFEVERLKGSDRYATNLAILNKAGVDTETEILIATGNNYADSLSASATGLPMLLVNKELTAQQKAFLEGTSKKFAILGGTAAVSAEIEAELAQIGEVVRVKGASRYETSVVIAERYFSEFNGAVLAYGEAFPDGLCGGPLAALIGGPLVLTHNDKLAAADALIEGVNYGYVTGGTARLTDATVQDIFDTAAEVVVK